MSPLRIVAALVAALLLPLVAGGLQAVSTLHGVFAPRPDVPAVTAPIHPYDPAKPTAAVVLGATGTVISDVFAPYEALAATEAFNLYTVAARPTTVPLTGGLDVVPDLTFAQLDARLGGRTPDVVVVPAMADGALGRARPVHRDLSEDDMAPRPPVRRGRARPRQHRVTALLGKLGARDRSQAALRARALGLL